ncbi:MAG: pyrroloquinoline quinone precursor peptide PqqA [Burkholderiales bacterium]|nr:pyrroloquinoline quinone precursor peptide PqqA [Burkholderiales bacterium]
MAWAKPEFTEVRFGFEVTMYSESIGSESPGRAATGGLFVLKFSCFEHRRR